MHSKFEVLLFSTDPVVVNNAVVAGVDGIIIDWEYADKERRQAYADTEINRDTIDDLRRVRKATDALVLCRLNSVGTTTAEEIEQAIDAGADEILLPMVRSIEEVEAVLNQVKERCCVGILIETVDAVRLASQLAQLPLSRIYVGLNDLAIERETPTIFAAVEDGTVERIRQAVNNSGVSFGFGGLTLPDRGYPIPCRLLIGEMIRLRCDFSLLRRSFYRDMLGHDLAVEIPRIKETLHQTSLLDEGVLRKNRRELEKAIQNWSRRVLQLRKTVKSE